MKSLFRLVLLFAVYLPVAWADATINATVVDSDGTAWVGGSYRIVLQNSQGGTATRIDNGQNVNPIVFGGTMDGTGSFSATITSANNIRPAGSNWLVTVCPNTTNGTCASLTILANASANISSQINPLLTAPRIGGGVNNQAYADVEVAAWPNNSYLNVTSNTLRCYTTSWGACGGGGGGGGCTPGASGYILLSTNTAGACANSLADYGVTSAGTFTFPASLTQSGTGATFTEASGFNVVAGSMSLDSTGALNLTASANSSFAFSGNLSVSTNSGLNITASSGAIDMVSSGDTDILAGGHIVISATGVGASLPLCTDSSTRLSTTGCATGGPPTGAAGGALTGTYPNPGTGALSAGTTAITQAAGDASTLVATDAFVSSAIATCTATAHGVINGISYTNCYTGSTFDVRVNAVMTDAEGLSNGNTTGIVDSTYEPQQVTQTGQITAGDGTHNGLWRLGAGLYSSVTLTGGTGYAVYHNPNWAIDCVGVQGAGCTFSSFSTASGMYALYGTNGAGYYYLNGLFFKNQHGSTLASGHVGIITAGYDGSLWQNAQFIDAPVSNPSDGAVVTVTGACCHANFTNDLFDSEWGATALDLEAHFNSIDFHNITANSHGASASGNPNILCHDTGPGTNSTVAFTGLLYMEGQAATMTAPWIEDSGCRAIDISGLLQPTTVVGSTSTTSPIIDISSAFQGTVSVGTVDAYSASGSSWTFPVTIVKQNNTTNDCASPPCNVAVTDSAGNSPGYRARTQQFNNVTVGGVIISNYNGVEPLSAGPSVAVGSEQYMGLAAERARFGYDGANTNAVVQGGSTKGVGLLYNNNTFGSGYGALLDPNGNFGVGTNATNATSDAFYVTSTGAIASTSTATEVLTLGSGIAAQNQYIGLDNNRAFFGYDSTNGNALHQGASGKGVGLAVNNATFGSGYVFVCDNAGTNCGIGTNASTASSDPFYVAVATGVITDTATALVPLAVGSGASSATQAITINNGRAAVGFDSGGSNALLSGSSGHGVGLQANNNTFGSGYVFLCDGSGTNCGIGTNASTPTSDLFYVTLSTGVAHGGGFIGPSSGEETVASSTTPTFSTSYRMSYNVLTANVTTFTLAAGADGQEKILMFCQNATGGFTVAPPANVKGFFTPGTTPSKCNIQPLVYSVSQSDWYGEGPGEINQ